jgi:hypothetical protein
MPIALKIHRAARMSRPVARTRPYSRESCCIHVEMRQTNAGCTIRARERNLDPLLHNVTLADY